ncbi:hypothetical protein V6N13_039630 [Hibiscus sabdariffa]
MVDGFTLTDHSVVSQGGRPSDGSVIVVDGDALERPGSPVHEGSQPVQKRVRSVDASMTEGVMAMDAELHETVRRDVYLAPPVADVGGGSQQLGLPSFKDKLLEGSGKLALAQAVTELEVDDECGGNGAVESAKAIVEPSRDPTELYGPWMQVSHRRRRPVVSQTIPISGAGTKGGKSASGSRFMALEEEPEGVVDMGGVQEDQSSNSRGEGLSGREGRVEEVVAALISAHLPYHLG